MSSTDHRIEAIVQDLQRGDTARAEAACRLLLARDRTHPQANHLLARILFGKRQYEQSVHLLKRALDTPTPDPWARLNLGEALLALGRKDEAVLQYRALTTNSSASEVILPAVGHLAQVGCNEEALELLRAARHAAGDSLDLLACLPMFTNYSTSLTREAVFADHLTVANLYTREYPPDPWKPANSRDPNRPLVIGYVSQDFRNRSAGHFIEPIITNHNRSNTRVHCYYNNYNGNPPDELTRRLIDRADCWLEVNQLTDREFTDRVRRDAVDILVDLSGYTGYSRLAPFCHRSAPIQITYMGYPNTTGLPTMDFRLVDAITDPVGSERFASERLIRLEGCFLCYAPPTHALAAQIPSPRSPALGMTFGSFNTLTKLTPVVADVWSRILASDPASRLLLKNSGLGRPGAATLVTEMFKTRGVPTGRLVARGETPSVSEHLIAYSEVDIALDTFPYNGTTTTIESLWMGVPVVTLAGQSHVSRVGVSLLTSLGLGELIAESLDDYVRIAVSLAQNHDRRAELRRTLRDRVRASLCDGATFTARLETVYRDVWREWCRGGS